MPLSSPESVVELLAALEETEVIEAEEGTRVVRVELDGVVAKVVTQWKGRVQLARRVLLEPGVDPMAGDDGDAGEDEGDKGAQGGKEEEGGPPLDDHGFSVSWHTDILALFSSLRSE